MVRLGDMSNRADTKPVSPLYASRAAEIEATLRSAGKPCNLSVSWSSAAADLRRACAARGITMIPASGVFAPGVDFYSFALAAS